jgi:septum formation protein
VILASRSPQRRAILETLGIAFEVRIADVVEEDDGPAETVARENALRKALAVADDADDLVLGVDTLVATDLEIWGKPPNEDAARETLRRLAGRTHRVVSGLALVCKGEVRTAVEVTEVTFRDLDDRLVDWYVGTGEWRERAGGYAIQGAGGALVRRIEGDYLNVVGLPVGSLLDLEPGLL